MLKISLALSSDAWTGQHPVWQTERNSEGLDKARGFLGRREQGQGSCTWKKSVWVIAKLLSNRGMAGVYQMIPDWLV